MAMRPGIWIGSAWFSLKAKPSRWDLFWVWACNGWKYEERDVTDENYKPLRFWKNDGRQMIDIEVHACGELCIDINGERQSLVWLDRNDAKQLRDLINDWIGPHDPPPDPQGCEPGDVPAAS
jgi:hypothetical protein